jgi:hypothetical protein
MKMNRAKEATPLQNAVVDYTMKNYSRPSFNNILALYVHTARGEKDTADALMRKISESAGSDNPVQCWVVATYKKENFTTELLEVDLGKNNYLLIAQKIAELNK